MYNRENVLKYIEKDREFINTVVKENTPTCVRILRKLRKKCDPVSVF